jgi:alginate O-acetyltransferase complex protein AlgI
VHHNDVLPQFRKLREQPYDFTNLQIGLTALTIGLFKKLVIADGLSEAVAPIFAASDQGIALPTLYAWLGALCYTFQLYFDFSGYSDMAIGAARLFGIRLPENFYSPYKSTSIIEFWRRWHMTLSRFLRDYLYISLGGNRKGYPRQLTNLMFTMLLGGLWHGAGWTFVIWGALHGTYLVINHLWMRYGGQLRNGLHNRLAYRSASSCLCFVAIVIAWVLFRSASLDGAFSMLNSMLYDFNLADKTPRFAEKIPTFTYILLPAAMAIAWLLPNTQQWMVSTNLTLSTMPEKKTRIRWSPSWYWAVFTGSLAVASFYKLIYMPNAITEFIYFQF